MMVAVVNESLAVAQILHNSLRCSELAQSLRLHSARQFVESFAICRVTRQCFNVKSTLFGSGPEQKAKSHRKEETKINHRIFDVSICIETQNSLHCSLICAQLFWFLFSAVTEIVSVMFNNDISIKKSCRMSCSLDCLINFYSVLWSLREGNLIVVQVTSPWTRIRAVDDDSGDSHRQRK